MITTTVSLAAGVEVALRIASSEPTGVEPHAGEGTDTAVERIAARLYREWYAAPVGPACGTLPPSSPPLAGLLRTAHAGSRRWEGGWRTRRAVGGSVLVAESQESRRGGGRRVVGPGDWVSDDHRAAGLVPSAGDPVRVCLRQDLLADGWWCTWGGGWTMTPATVAGAQPAAKEPLLRVYLAPFVDAVADVVAAVTDVTLTWEHPWMLKAATDPGSYHRADPVVLYVAREHSRRVARDIRPAVAGLAASLRPVHPPLSLPVERGTAVAEDPPGELSFGEHRCSAIARGVVSLPHDPYLAVARALRRLGIDPLAPYRAPAERSVTGSRSPGTESPSLAAEEAVPWNTWWR